MMNVLEGVSRLEVDINSVGLSLKASTTSYLRDLSLEVPPCLIELMIYHDFHLSNASLDVHRQKMKKKQPLGT